MILKGKPAWKLQSVTPSGEMTANVHLEHIIPWAQAEKLLGHIDQLHFWDPNSFSAGELHNHLGYWEKIATLNPCEQHDQVPRWIRSRVSIFPYFQHFTGSFKGIRYDSDPLSFSQAQEQCHL